MTKKSLQEFCDKQGLKVKVLYVKTSGRNDNYAIYTLDLNYNPRNRHYATSHYIIEPELDDFFEDEKDFAFWVKRRESEVKNDPTE